MSETGNKFSSVSSSILTLSLSKTFKSLFSSTKFDLILFVSTSTLTLFELYSVSKSGLLDWFFKLLFILLLLFIPTFNGFVFSKK